MQDITNETKRRSTKPETTCPPAQKLAQEVKDKIGDIRFLTGSLPPIPPAETLTKWPTATLGDMRRELKKLLNASGKTATLVQTGIECVSNILPTMILAVASDLPNLVLNATKRGELRQLDAGLAMLAGLTVTKLVLERIGSFVTMRRPMALDRALEDTMRTRGGQLKTSLNDSPDAQNKCTKITEKSWLIKNCCEAYRALLPEALAFCVPLIAMYQVSGGFTAVFSLIGMLSIIQGHCFGKELAITADCTAEPTRAYFSKSSPLRRPGGMIEAKRIGKSGELNREIAQDHETITEAYMPAEERMNWRGALTTTFTVSTALLATAYGAFSAIAGTMTFKDGLFLGGAAAAFGVAMTNFCGHIRVFAQAKEYLREYTEVGKQAEISAPHERDPNAESERRWDTPPSITLRNANAVVRRQGDTYPKAITEHTLLSNVNLNIKAGSLAAIVGLSGAGKSTLIRLLTGELQLGGEDPEIRIGDMVLSDETLPELRANTGIMAQKPLLIEGKSVQGNVNLGLSIWNESQDPDKAKRQASIMEFLDRHQVSSSSIVGADFTNGRQLSPGEVKLVGFARVLNTGSKLLILDEPTSSVDPHTAIEVRNQIKQLTDTTRLVVTHDPKLVEMSDYVIVVNRHGHPLFAVDPIGNKDAPGEIALMGTHEELRDKSPEYRAFFGFSRASSPPQTSQPVT